MEDFFLFIYLFWGKISLQHFSPIQISSGLLNSPEGCIRYSARPVTFRMRKIQSCLQGWFAFEWPIKACLFLCAQACGKSDLK